VAENPYTRPHRSLTALRSLANASLTSTHCSRSVLVLRTDALLVNEFFERGDAHATCQHRIHRSDLGFYLCSGDSGTVTTSYEVRLQPDCHANIFFD
jgi:hypothetical protein